MSSCCSHLVWFHPYMCLFSVRKHFCDLSNYSSSGLWALWLGLGRLCSFLPIILFFCFHKLHLLFFLMHLLFSVMLTGFQAYAYKNKKVVTIINIAFLSGYIPALLKAACSSLKKILTVNIRNLLLGMRLQSTWLKEIASLQCFGHLIGKVYLLILHLLFPKLC